MDDKKYLSLPDMIEQLKDNNGYRDDVRYFIYFNPVYLEAIEEDYTIAWITWENDIGGDLVLNYGCGACIEDASLTFIASSQINEEKKIILCPKINSKNACIKYLN